MATCENPHCGKTNLRKADVELDVELRQILCAGCYCLRHPGWFPSGDLVSEVLQPMQLSYEVSISSDDGLRARVGYGDVNVSFHAPMGEIKRVLGQ